MDQVTLFSIGCGPIGVAVASVVRRKGFILGNASDPVPAVVAMGVRPGARRTPTLVESVVRDGCTFDGKLPIGIILPT